MNYAEWPYPAETVSMPLKSLTQRRKGAKTRSITGSGCLRNRSLNSALFSLKAIPVSAFAVLSRNIVTFCEDFYEETRKPGTIRKNFWLPGFLMEFFWLRPGRAVPLHLCAFALKSDCTVSAEGTPETGDLNDRDNWSHLLTDIPLP